MKNKKNMMNALFLIVVFLITMYAVFKGQDLKQLFFYIREADVRYWEAAVVCVFLFCGGEAVIIYYMMRSIGIEIRLLHCLLYSFIGFFFSCITPGASGGQPMQIYYMKKDNISISVSTLVLMIVTITYKLVLVMLGAAVLLFRPKTLMFYLKPILGWCYLGLGLNVFAVVSMFILVFDPVLMRVILQKILQFLIKIHFVKKGEHLMARAEQSMNQYRDVSKYFRAHKSVVVNVFGITILQRAVMFSVLYLTYRSFGFHKIPLLDLTALQGMISVAADMLPLPGGMGITEKLFIEMFTPVFHHMTLAVMVVSRSLSYYTEIFISAIFSLVAYFTIGRIKNDRIL